MKRTEFRLCVFEPCVKRHKILINVQYAYVNVSEIRFDKHTKIKIKINTLFGIRHTNKKDSREENTKEV